MRKLLLSISCVFISMQLLAGPTWAYRINFTDKVGGLTIANANQYLTAASIARRAKFNIPIEFTDIPVVQTYVNSVMSLSNAIRLHNKSNWFNQIVILTNDTSNISAVRALPYVNKVKLVGYYPAGWGFKGTTNPISDSKIATIEPAKKERGSEAYYGASYKQIHLMNADYLHDLGYKGENMNIAVIDMGFYKTDSLTAFVTMNALGHLKDTWNFVRDTVNIFKANATIITHGTDALTTMASLWPGIYVGTAPYANYYCYMSEDLFFESPIEEDNWISAAERADSMGVQIINTSLGYSEFDADFAADNYTYANMDGKTTLISRGQNMAFRKGIFCVAANGNGGLTPWHYVAAPADADSVYSVGSVDSSGVYLPAIGSSFGPSADGQVKPDGLSVGGKVALVGNNNVVGYTGGSSFASPTLCGAIACLMQALPNIKIGEIKKLIHQSSSRFATPSDSMGYGIPNFKMAYLAGLALGVDNLQMGNELQYTLFPNPTFSNLTVESKEKSNMQISILDAMGKTVISNKNVQTSESFSVAALAPGLYNMQIIQDKMLVIKQFIKK